MQISTVAICILVGALREKYDATYASPVDFTLFLFASSEIIMSEAYSCLKGMGRGGGGCCCGRSTICRWILKHCSQSWIQNSPPL